MEARKRVAEAIRKAAAGPPGPMLSDALGYPTQKIYPGRVHTAEGTPENAVAHRDLMVSDFWTSPRVLPMMLVYIQDLPPLHP